MDISVIICDIILLCLWQIAGKISFSAEVTSDVKDNNRLRYSGWI